ncbi:hypothetical protein QBC35DRAFT_389974 [Podospora australis]|uniref:Uncharacterized protein n=1 Tax=Podospora australis TaxID=1536484 RepID=A0AAN6WRS6_9PEZI|nr:hypothetical protein QBC35DRAFT_389974 [Podospora australis]
MGLFERIQAKIELFRLEQRYTRRRNRRSTFVSTAVYVDGEYIYQSPNSTGSSSSTASSANSANTRRSNSVAVAAPAPSPSPSEVDPAQARRKLNRWSSMPGFGSGSRPDGMPRMDSVAEGQDWRRGGRSSFER